MTFLFDVLHVDGDDLLDTPLEQRAARLDAIAPQLRIPRVLTSDPEEGAARPRRGAAGGPRGRRRQGRRLALRGRAARQGVAQGEAGADVRPRRARRRMGPRPAARLALEPASGGPRPGHGRVRDGGQVLQGPDGRAARAGRRRSCSSARPSGRESRCSSARSSSSRSPSTASSPRRAIPGGVALRFARVKRYRPDKDGRRSGHHRRPARAAPRLVAKPRRIAGERTR